MTKKKHGWVIALVLCLVVASVVLFVVCKEPAHTHEYGYKWEMNTTQHWRECECGEKSEEGDHIYDNNCDMDCNTCGYIRAIYHDYSTTWSSDDVYHWHECTICESRERGVAHTYQAGHDETNHWQECTDCGHKIDEIEHTFDNNCDTDCNECGYIRTITHDYSTTWSKSDAYHWRECTVCHAKDSEIAHSYKTEHDETNHWQECTVCGYKKDITEHTFDNGCDTDCNDCGYTRTTTHIYGEWVEVDDDNHKHTCSICGDIQTATHTYQAGHDETNHWQECTVCGHKKDIAEHTFDDDCDIDCNDCGYVREGGHQYGTSLSVYGTKHAYICSVCGNIDETSLADHTYDDGICSGCGDIENVEYTYDSSIDAYILSNGRNIVVTAISIPATYNDGTNGNHPVALIDERAFLNCTNLTIVTISTNVTWIRKDAFYECSHLEKVKYLGTIDQWVQIKFFDGDSNPLYYAKEFYINDELTTSVNITTATEISAYAFYNFKYLTSVTIGDSVTSIGTEAFYNCYGLINITIGNNVRYIGVQTFRRCFNLTSITIPASVETILTNAFSDCYKLVEIYDPANNWGAGASSGYLAKYKLVKHTSLDTPSRLTTDENGFVIYTNGDDKILVNYIGSDTIPTLPSDINKINQYAFYGSYVIGITGIIIGTNVTSIGDNALNDSSFNYIYYAGTVSEWSRVSIDDSKNGVLSRLYYYVENEADVPTDDNNYWHYDTDGKTPVIWTKESD